MYRKEYIIGMQDKCLKYIEKIIAEKVGLHFLKMFKLFRNVQNIITKTILKFWLQEQYLSLNLLLRNTKYSFTLIYVIQQHLIYC